MVTTLTRPPVVADITKGSWVTLPNRLDGPFHVVEIKSGWLRAERLDWGEVKAPLAGATLTEAPAKCGCDSPAWRFLNGQQWPALGESQQWVCLNCSLHDAIHLYHDDNRKYEIMALIDATRPAKRVMPKSQAEQPKQQSKRPSTAPVASRLFEEIGSR